MNQLVTEKVRTLVNSCLEKTKRGLLKNGSIPRLVYVFGPKKAFLKNVEVQDQKEFESTASDGFVAVLDLSTNPENYLEMVRVIDPELGTLVDKLLAMAPAMGVSKERAPFHVKRALESSGRDEGGIVTAFLRKILSDFEAYAYVHISEMWMAPSRAGEAYKPPSECDNREEVVGVLWETKEAGEQIMVPFTRVGGKVGEGPVDAFKEPRIIQMTTLSGRMSNLLVPIPKAQA